MMRQMILGAVAASAIALTIPPGAQARDVIATRGETALELTMQWDHKPQAKAWTQATMEALQSHGQSLASTVPADITEWCPDYPDNSPEARNAFWTGLLSALTYHESTWRPTAVGGGGKWYGLTQILPATARHYGCEARSGEALKDGELNLACAVRIMAKTVPRDNVVAKGMRGVAADWGPFHSSKKREDMRQWVREQPYCSAG